MISKELTALVSVETSDVAEFEFLVQGDHEEEKIREYLNGFGVDVLEVWS